MLRKYAVKSAGKMGGSITKKRQLCEIMSSLDSAALLQVVFLEKGDLNFVLKRDNELRIQ